jgi:carbon-monoxide dehydrogenase medium subunit
VSLLSETEGVACLAGGTDLMVQMRDGRRSPKALVDISALGFAGIQKENGGWSIGATTTMTELQQRIASNGPSELSLLSEAAGRLGAHQIQNRATVGGNICNASPAADTVCALLALDAEVRLVGPSKKRGVALADFLEGPGKTGILPGELLESVWVPKKERKAGDRVCEDYVKIGGRTSLVCAIASLAARTVIRGSRVISCSMALGSVAPTCMRAKACEELLQGNELTAEMVGKVGETARSEVSPIDDLRASGAYRLDVVQAMVTEHLSHCLDTIEEGGAQS